MITSFLAGVHVEEVMVSDEEQKTKEFKQKCLTGKFPILETSEGVIFESAAIARYLARLNPDARLIGFDNLENALIDQFIDFAKGSVIPHIMSIALATFGW